jgi:flagellar protein FliJ
MTNHDSWTRIKELAVQRRDESARGLAKIVKRAHAAQQKLELLLEYRADYRARFDAASRTGMRGESLRNYQAFLANLEQAITLQSDAIAALDRELSDAKRHVDGAHRRAESYQVIDDRRSNVVMTRERRRAQRQQDEMASRIGPRWTVKSEN